MSLKLTYYGANDSVNKWCSGSWHKTAYCWNIAAPGSDKCLTCTEVDSRGDYHFGWIMNPRLVGTGNTGFEDQSK